MLLEKLRALSSRERQHSGGFVDDHGTVFAVIGRSGSGIHGRPFSPHYFHGFEFFGGDGLDDEQIVIIQQSQPAPTANPSEPPENRVYVQPRWVADGGYGVQVLQPGYWSTPTQAAKH